MSLKVYLGKKNTLTKVVHYAFNISIWEAFFVLSDGNIKICQNVCCAKCIQHLCCRNYFSKYACVEQLPHIETLKLMWHQITLVHYESTGCPNKKKNRNSVQDAYHHTDVLLFTRIRWHIRWHIW